MFLTATDAVFQLTEGARGSTAVLDSSRVEADPESRESRASVMRLCYLGANPSPQVTGAGELPFKTYYFVGADPSRWVRDVPAFSCVRYESMYPGVDLVWHGEGGRIEYELEVSPGVSLDDISLCFEGVDGLFLDVDGGLVLTLDGSTIRQSRPVFFAGHDGSRKPVAGSYVLKNGNEVGFAVGSFDISRGVLIDPVLEFSSYLGGNSFDEASGIALDPDGVHAYVIGRTFSGDFPESGWSGPPKSVEDVFLSKFTVPAPADPISDLDVVWSVILGGSSTDEGNAIAFNYCISGLNATPYLFVAGSTASDDFPTVLPYQPLRNGTENDAFLARLDPTGTRLGFSTYLGGSQFDCATTISVDAAGRLFLAGDTRSSDMPPAPPRYQLYPYAGEYDGYTVEMTPGAQGFYYSTYLGGAGNDHPWRARLIAVDTCGRSYLVGYTESANYPLAREYQSSLGNPRDTYFTVIRNTESKPSQVECQPNPGNPFDPCKFACDDGKGHFCPEAPVTREELAQILLQAKNIPPDENAPQEFVDVPPCNPFYGWVQAAARLPVVTPCFIGSGAPGLPTALKWYCPERPATRAEAAEFLVALSQFTGDRLSDPQCDTVFCDAQIGGVCTNAEALHNAGIEPGDGCYLDPAANVRRFCPDVPITRKLVARWMSRWMHLTETVPPYQCSSGPRVFQDVPAGYGDGEYCRHIEKFAGHVGPISHLAVFRMRVSKRNGRSA